MGNFIITWTPSDHSDFFVTGGTTGSRTWQGFSPTMTVDGVPTDILGLPAGFTVTAAHIGLVSTATFNNGSGAPVSDQSSIQSSLINYSSPTRLLDLTLLPGITLAQLTYPEDTSFFTLWTELFKITSNIDNTVNSVLTSLGWTELFIQTTGTYAIAGYQWSLDNNAYKPFDRAILTSPTGTPDLKKVKEIDFQYTDVNGKPKIKKIRKEDFLDQTQYYIIFIIFEIDPPLPDKEAIPEVIFEFSGSVTLTPIIITYENASGIYSIKSNKTNDTIYIDSASGSPTTNDVKIPNPYIKTGFIP